MRGSCATELVTYTCNSKFHYSTPQLSDNPSINADWAWQDIQVAAVSGHVITDLGRATHG